MFLECKTTELSSSLFPKLYKSGKFRVRNVENTSQFKQQLKSPLSTKELTGLNFISNGKVRADDRVILLADCTYGNACCVLALLSFTRVRKIAKSDNQLLHVCPSVRQHGRTQLPLDGFS